jgi:two-component system, sensor histidine kinase and response regulator
MKARILIVDDDSALLEALSQAVVLRIDGATADTCDSAQAALDRISTADYDAIVADIKMPGMDGLELLAEIRKLRPDTPTLLITGHGEHELAVQALRGGARDYVQKPIDRDYFIASLKRAIQSHQLSHQIEKQRLALDRRVRKLEECVQEHADGLREFFHREQRARAELDEAKHQLEEAHRQREEFIAMVAHELGGPLTVLLGYTDALGDPDTSLEAQDRARGVIASEIRRMARLVEDLADAANLAAGRFRIQPIPCDLADLLREQVELARATTDRHTIHLDARSARARSVCDRGRLAQVVSNLLANAIKYTPAGQIRVRLRVEGQQVWISVSDDGPGIPPDRLETVFQPYVRLSSVPATGERKGTGLGLHIAKGIVEAHGGRMSITSTPGHGATFHVCLPLAPLIVAAAPEPRTA